MTNRVVYLMRGLPSCGKSFTARKLAGDTGIVCETDEYFYTEVGEDRTSFDYREDLMETARQWNLNRFRNALQAGTLPIVVDRGNGLSTESQAYARIALEHGYSVQLREPDSPWWKEISSLLRDKERNRELLDKWAILLSQANKATHRVSASNIRRKMDRWICDLTVEDILRYKDHCDRA
jgi:hypothetical protein